MSQQVTVSTYPELQGLNGAWDRHRNGGWIPHHADGSRL